MTNLRLAFGFAALAILILALAPASALAGSCPICTSSSECTSFDDGGVAFCVLHAGPVGCGTEVMLCCPGQGCNTFTGRPSCEGSTCTVVESLVDAGPAAIDGGPSATDSGTGGVDSGPGGVDSGASPIDGGAAAMDSGTAPPAVTTSGCSCRMATTASDAPLFTAVLLGAAIAGRRRARARR